MNGNIVGEEFEGYVFDQIGLRQEAQAKGFDGKRSSSDLQYLSNTNSWVKLASPVFIDPLEGKKRLRKILGNDTQTKQLLGLGLAKNSVLFNGLTSFNGKTYTQRAGIVKNVKNLWNTKPAYGLGGPDFGIVPFPYISDISIRCLERGSIRKAQVSIRAFNKFQFEILELLYLRLGFTMMLEYGNNKYYTKTKKGYKLNTTNTTIIERTWFSDKSRTQLSVLEEIGDLREEYKGNYDGFFGKVVNFDWTFEEDGSYSIVLDLITLGDVIESLQINTPVSYFTVDQIKKQKESTLPTVGFTEDEYEDFKENDTLVTTAQNDIISAWIFNKISNDNLWLDTNNKDWVNLKEAAIDSSEAGQVSQDIVKRIPPEYSYFISFGKLLYFLKDKIIPLIDNEGEKADIVDLYTGDNYFMNYFPNQISTDPKICIIRPEFGGADIEIINEDYPIYYTYFNKFVTNNSKVVYGNLKNVYLNAKFIKSCISVGNNEKLSLFRFLKNICDGINEALGGVNKLEPVIDADVNSVKIIDKTPIPGIVQNFQGTPEIVPFELFGYNLDKKKKTTNFVKDFKLNTNIGPELATQITIGATANQSIKNEDATAFSKWNRGLVDRFSLKIEEKKPEVDPNETPQEAQWRKEADALWEESEEATYKKSAFQFLTYYKYNPERRIMQWADGRHYSKDFNAEQYIKRQRMLAKKGIPTEAQYREFTTRDWAGYLSNSFGGSLKYTVARDNVTTLGDVRQDQRSAVTNAVSLKTGMVNPFVGYGLYATQKTLEFFGFYDKDDDNKIVQTKVVPAGDGKHNWLLMDASHIAKASNVYKNYLNTLYRKIFKQTGSPSPTVGFIPITLNLTCDGLSGMKIYNKLNVNQKFLPPNYPESLTFLITKVNHKVGDNKWTTELETLSVPAVDPNSLDELRKKMSLSPDQYELILPVNERGPKATDEALKVLDNRNDEMLDWNVEGALSALSPNARTAFTPFFNTLKNKYGGYTLIINSIGRSLEKSQELQQENPQNAPPGQSKHNFDAAVDFNVRTPNGDTLMKSSGKYKWINHGFEKLAKDNNIIWGGTFDGYDDFVHFASPVV